MEKKLAEGTKDQSLSDFKHHPRRSKDIDNELSLVASQNNNNYTGEKESMNSCEVDVLSGGAHLASRMRSSSGGIESASDLNMMEH